MADKLKRVGQTVERADGVRKVKDNKGARSPAANRQGR